MLKSVRVFGKKLVDISVRKSPSILAGLGVAGVVTTAFLAGKFALEAKPIMDEAKKTVDDIQESAASEEVKKKEIKSAIQNAAKKVAPKAVPVVIAGGATIGCILGGHTISMKRTAVLAAAYELSQSKILEDEKYIEKAKELLGKEKDLDIRKAVNAEMRERLENEAPPARPFEKRYVCRDGVKGGVCYATKYEIEKAFLWVEKDIMSKDYGFTPLNDLYDYLNMPTVDDGDEWGWNAGDDPCFSITWEDDDTMADPTLVFRYKAYKNSERMYVGR